MLFLLLILIVSMGMVSASDDNQTLGVDEMDVQAVAEINVSSNNFAQIEDVINQVGDGGSVRFVDEIYSPDKSEVENDRIINVNKSVNLIGVGKTTFDGNYGNGILNIEDAGNVVIENIRFTKVDGSTAVNIRNSNVTFRDCFFDYNQGNIGTAINVFGEGKDVSTNVINCSFIWNLAYSIGVGGFGGAISIVSQKCIAMTSIINSTFENNSARRGGSIYINSDESKTGHLNVDNCRFFGNFILPNIDETEPPEVTGADISVFDTSNYEIIIINSNFTEDRYPGEGKGNLNQFEYSVVLTNYNNSIENCNFINNTVCFAKTDSSIINCNFTQAVIGVYHDVYAFDEVNGDDIKLTIENCSFIKSDIELGQGLIRNSNFIHGFVYKSSDNELAIDNCPFSDESIVLISGKTNILNSNFTECSYVDSLTYVNLLVDNCSFKEGMAMNGAAIYVDRGSEDKDAKRQSVITVTNSSFINNTARYWGGAIYINSYKTNVDIGNCIFLNNSARNGGAIYSLKATSNIHNCIFDGNKAQNNDNITYAFLTKQDMDVSSEYEFEYYENEIYAADLENWDGNRYSFPDYVYGRQVYDGGLASLDYYGSAVFGNNLNLDANFWGLNIASSDELFLNRIIGNEKITPKTWVNFENGSYVLNNHTEIAMPQYVPDVSRINKKTAELIVNIVGNSYGNIHANFKLVDNETKDPIRNQEIIVVTSYGMYGHVFTNVFGKADYNIENDAGIINLLALSEIDGYKVASAIVSNIKISKREIAVTAASLSTTYASLSAMNITAVYKDTKKPVRDVLLSVKVFTGKKYKNYQVFTNEKGLAKFRVSSIAAGTHNVEITSGDKNYALSKVKVKLVIKKVKTTVKAPKVTNKYKKLKYFKVTVKDKATKKAIKNLKIKVKVGKKTFAVKTNSKGIAKLNTKSLKIGKYKVVVSSGNSNYAVSAKSTIVIKK